MNEINSEIDRRKLQKLVDAGKISAEELAEAPIYTECPKCKYLSQSEIRCPKCGEVW